MPLDLIQDHASTLAKKLPTLYRRRSLVLLGLLALHLFVVTPFVRLTGEEQIHLQEADLLQTRIEHAQSVEDDIRLALNRVRRQKADLLDELVTGFKELNDARAALVRQPEDRFAGNQFPTAGPFQVGQFQAPPGQPAVPDSRFAKGVREAEAAPDSVGAYRELIRSLILEPAFSEANRRWQDEQRLITADLAKIRQGLAADDNFDAVTALLVDLDQDVRTHRFTAPEGDWWATVEGKKTVLDKDLARITSTLQDAITPLAESSTRLEQKIAEQKAILAQTRAEKQTLADRAAQNLQRVETSLNIAVIDGVQAMTFFPVLLAVASGLMTIDICRCLQALHRCRSIGDAALQADITQWMTVAARPSFILHGIAAVWILIAALHVRPLNTETTRLVGQTAVALFILVTVAVWEGMLRRQGTLAPETASDLQVNDSGEKG